jgi:hypothetical protein
VLAFSFRVIPVSSQNDNEVRAVPPPRSRTARTSEIGDRGANQIPADYLTYLGRTPSTSEVSGWVMYFQLGARNEDVVAGFVGSEEHFKKYTT